MQNEMPTKTTVMVQQIHRHINERKYITAMREKTNKQRDVKNEAQVQTIEINEFEVRNRAKRREQVYPISLIRKHEHEKAGRQQ